MWLPCPECADESVFEQPPCEEGHGAECPEWFCVACGYAVLVCEAQVGLLSADSSPAAPGRRRSRPHAA
jgi:hypothetical protein